MKIVILSDSFPPNDTSGAAVVAYNHARGLINRGFAVAVVTTSFEAGKAGLSNYEGLTVYTIYSAYNPGFRAYRSISNPEVVKKADAFLAQIEPDIIHAHNIHQHLSYAVLKAARARAKKVFLTCHDSMPFHYSKLFPETIGALGGEVESYKVSAWTQLRLFKSAFNPLRNIKIRKYLKIPDKIFSVSDALRQALNDNGIGNVETIHNGINASEWQDDVRGRDEFEKRFRLAGKKVIFFGGRLSRAKGGDVILNVLSDICKRERETILLTVGSKDSYAEEMQKRANLMGIKDNIIFTGRLSRQEMKYAYAVSDVVAVPSLCFDWFPTIILEAMASRKPVVGSCFGGANEMIEHGETGFIVNPYKRAELLSKISTILRDRELATKLGRNALARVAVEFSEQRFIDDLIARYAPGL